MTISGRVPLVSICSHNRIPRLVFFFSFLIGSPFFSFTFNHDIYVG